MRKKILVFCCAAALAVSAAGCSPAEKAPAQETQTEQQTEAPETEESSQEAEGSAQEMAAAPQTVKFYGELAAMVMTTASASGRRVPKEISFL